MSLFKCQVGLNVKYSKFLKFGIFLLVFQKIAVAQIDTSFQLPTAFIKSSTSSAWSQLNSSSVIHSPDDFEEYHPTNIGELINNRSTAFVKSYGLGSLATTSIRGGSAGHTAVIWNGFSLQSPMLGLLDFAQIPTVFIDFGDVSHGGNSALWGSGAVGGEIHLKSSSSFNKGFSVNFQNSFGNFGFWDLQSKVHYSDKKFGVTTRYFRQEAENDFSFQIGNLPKKKQSNAATFQTGILQELYWKPKPNQQLDLRIWSQKVDKQIPPLTTQTRSFARQEDDIFRTALHYKYIGQKSILNARLGIFREAIDYQDEQFLIRALSYFWVGISEVENEFQLSKNQRLLIGLNHTYTTASADGYTGNTFENRSAIFAAHHFSTNHFHTQISARQAFVNGKFGPFVPNFSISWKFHKSLIINAKISRNYRIPTLNDRFWSPGGNENLKPESGWSQELNLTFRREREKNYWNLQVGGFNRNIDNWILWSIREGENFWSAQNITEVWSRGLEQKFNWIITKMRLKFYLSGGYEFVLSTHKNDLHNPKIEAGEQLFYVPKHRAFSRFKISNKNLRFTYQHQFTGAVNGINDDLENYHIGSCSLDWNFNWKYKILKSNLFFNVENIWNGTYRVVERRPMPGRYFRMGIKLKIHK